MDLKEAREAVGLTQLGLDREAHVGPGTVHDIESGRSAHPSHETAIKITRALRRRGLAALTSEQLFPVADHTRGKA